MVEDSINYRVLQPAAPAPLVAPIGAHNGKDSVNTVPINAPGDLHACLCRNLARYSCLLLCDDCRLSCDQLCDVSLVINCVMTCSLV